MSGQRFPTTYPGVFFRHVRRIGGKGTEKAFYAVWKQDGRTREALCGYEFRNAMTPARAAKIRGEFIEGQRLTRKEKRKQAAANMTIAQLWAAYSPTLTKKRSLQSATVDFGRTPPKIQGKRPFEVTSAEVAAWDRAMLEDGLSPQTRRHSLALMERLIRWGIKNGHCDPAPHLNIKLPHVDNKKTEVLSDQEVARLMEALDADFDQLSANAVRLVMLTGVRRSALFALEWSDVDFERGFLTLRGDAAKSGRTNRIPLSAGAREILEELRDSPTRRTDCEIVFPTRNGARRSGLPKDFVRRIRERAQLPEGFRFLHGLRHHFASSLATSGKVDLYTLQHLLTHESPSMTQRYAHLMDEALRRAAGVVDEIFKKDAGKA